MVMKDKGTSQLADKLANVDPDKLRALTLAIEKIEKDHGRGTVMALGDRVQGDVPCIPTGSILFDAALGIGGYPKGRIVEIFGPESSGKTTLATHAIAQVQRTGGVAAIIDAEHAFDPAYAAQLGVNVDMLLISQPDNGEQALEIAEQLIRSGAMDLVVIDSVAALTPRAELEGDMGDAKVGLQARLMSQALRKLTGTISKTSTTCIFINQLREKIGGMGYGPNETKTGGNALKFYSTLRIDIRRIGSLKDSNEEQYGNRVRIRIVKNKLAPPFKKVECDLVYGEGLSRSGEIIDLGVAFGLIEKSGSWFSYEGTRLAQGRDNVRRILMDNKELADAIEAKIRERMREEPDKLKF